MCVVFFPFNISINHPYYVFVCSDCAYLKNNVETMDPEGENSDDSDYEQPLFSFPSDSTAPPPLPPPRATSLTFPRQIHSHSSTRFPSYDSSLCFVQMMRQSLAADFKFSLPKEPVQLSHFITRYSALLPCKVKMCTSAVAAITPGNVLRLHFIKHNKIVVMKEIESGESCSIPLYSSTKFGLVVRTNSSQQNTIANEKFTTAGEVMAKKPLPLVMKATRCFKGSSAESSVEEGEILWISGLKTPKNSLRLKQQLQVQSLHSGKKLLSEKCAGAFVTSPDDIQLPLMTLLDLGLQLPQHAIVFIEGTANHQQSNEVMKHQVLLEKMAGVTTIVASHNVIGEKKEVSYLELCSDLEIKVDAIEMDHEENKELQSQTLDLYQNFTQSKSSFISHKLNSSVQKLQNQLYGQYLPGCELKGMQLVRPSMLSYNVQHNIKKFVSKSGRVASFPSTPEIQVLVSTSHAQSMPPIVENDNQIFPDNGALENEYVYMARLNSNSELLNTYDQKSHSQDFESDALDHECHSAANIPPTKIQAENVTSFIPSCKQDTLTENVGSLSVCLKQQNSIRSELQKLQFALHGIQKDIELLKQTICTPAEYQIVPSPEEEEKHTKNRRFLATLTTSQVSIQR